jgi:hypothetical protein
MAVARDAGFRWQDDGLAFEEAIGDRHARHREVRHGGREGPMVERPNASASDPLVPSFGPGTVIGGSQ